MRNNRSFPIWRKHKGLKYSIIQEFILKSLEDFIKTLFLIVKTGNHLIFRIVVKNAIVLPHNDTELKIRFLKNDMEKKTFDITSEKVKYKITYTL